MLITIKKIHYLILFLSAILIFIFINDQMVNEWGDIVDSIINKKQYNYLGRPSAYMPPLYPFLISGFKILFLNYGIKILHTSLFIITYILINKLIIHLVFIFFGNVFEKNVKVQILYLFLPILFFIYPPVLYGYLHVSIFPISTFLFLLYIYNLSLINYNGNNKLLFSLGLITGLLTLARSEFIYLGTLSLIFYLILIFKKKYNFNIMKFIFIHLIGALLVLTPWIVRNKITLGEPIISTAKYYNLWRGNNKFHYTIPITPEAYYKNLNLNQVFTEVEQEKFLKIEFEKYVKENPSHFILGVFKKIRNYVFSYYPIINSDDYHGKLMQYLFIPWAIILLITTFLFYKSVKLKKSPIILTMIFFYFAYSGVHGLTQVLPRYNLQFLIPFLIIDILALIEIYLNKLNNKSWI